MKPNKGMRFKEWVKVPMDKQNVTTARVFLILGYILGTLSGLCLMALFNYQ